jgi:PAS domain S-box-containing protein
VARSDARNGHIQPRDIADAEEIKLLKDEIQAQAWDLEMQYRTMQDMLGELEESRKRYADLYDYAPAGYVTFDERGCISEINLAGAALLGMERSRVLGMPMAVFLDKGSCKLFFDHLRSCRLSGNKVITELKLAPKNASAIHAQIISMPLPGADGYGSEYRSNIVDITERKLMEKEMSRMENLHLVGQMAAGIAHEIRNPMTTVRGFLQTFMRRKEYAQIHSQLGLMVTELDRANSIITEYLALARTKPLDLSPHSLNEIIASLLPLMESDALLHEKWVVSQLSADLPQLLLDAQEMRQLILNLVRNGLEAMARGGRLTIGTVAERDHVILFVQDQGSGIPAEVLAKLGTPFLTTKDNGTGLGLPICYSIAHRHNAQIDVKTGDSGTTFSVKFPRT